jgi:hypothetical protein
MESEKRINKLDIYWSTAILFIAIKLCLHFLTNTSYELHRDEMLYFNMAEHLSFGYATVPPVIGFLAGLIKTVFGYSVFGIRLIPALSGAASIFIVAKIIRELGGGVVALIITSTSFLLSTGYLLMDTLFTPNFIEQFLWLLITYYIFRMISLNDLRIWIRIGILLGLAFLNKYSVIFFILGFFIALLFTSHRRVLNSRYFYYSVIAGFFIILPNLLWQYAHGWPVVFHMSELKRTQMANLTISDYFVDIFSLNQASSLIWITGFFSLLFFKQEKKHRYIGVASLIIIVLFLILKGKGYYILGLIPILFAFGGYTMEKYFTGRLAIINYIVLFITLSLSIVALPFGLPVMSFEKLMKYNQKTNHLIIYPFYRWEDGKIHNISQVYSDMTGWKELTGYVAEAFNRLSAEKQKKCTIYVESDYGNAGAINFYGKKYNLPDAITFLESYTIWAPDTIPDGPFIYINNRIGDINKLFNGVTEIGSISDVYAREKGLMVFLCTDPALNVREVYRQRAFEEKKRYSR